MAGRDVEAVMQGVLFGDAMLNAEVGALVADERGYYIAVNEAVCELTGYTRDQLTKFRAGELAGDEESKDLYERLLQRKKLQGKKVVRCQDGTLVPCRYWGIPTTIAKLPYFVLLVWAVGAPQPDTAG